jgi:hypothetical protein
MANANETPDLMDEEDYLDVEPSIEDCIRRNPLVAVMGAFLIGLIFGRLRIL